MNAIVRKAILACQRTKLKNRGNAIALQRLFQSYFLNLFSQYFFSELFTYVAFSVFAVNVLHSAYSSNLTAPNETCITVRRSYAEPMTMPVTDLNYPGICKLYCNVIS